jgi:Spy/CpxP family protein refolding chaperone
MSGKIKAVVLLGVMYAFGVASGIAWQACRPHHVFGDRPAFSERRIKRLSSRLHLSTTQEQALRDIFQTAHVRATKVNEDVSRNLATIHRDSVEAIGKILTPEQNKEFAQLHQRFHTRHEHLPDDEAGSR